MALNFNRVNFNVRNITVDVTVPNTPVARLMYYLNCLCSLLQLDTSDSPNIHRLTQYSLHWALTPAQKRELAVLCLILSPDELLNKCIFIDNNLKRLNEFYEISAVQDQLFSTLLLQQYYHQRSEEAGQQNNVLSPFLAKQKLHRTDANHVIPYEDWCNLENRRRKNHSL